MNDEVRTLTPDITSALVTSGDLKRLTHDQKIAYYLYRCSQAQLDPSARPFDLLTLNGKEVLYANAGCTQQLCANRGLSYKVTSRERTEDLYMVCVQVTDRDQRSTENMGAVSILGLKGETLANAMMKAQTKAIRRTVLAHCGLGMLDETEVSSSPGAIIEVSPWSEPIPQEESQEPEWTDEQRRLSLSTLGDLDEALEKGGFPEGSTKYISTMKTYKDQVGTLDFERWCNRVAAAISRIPQPTEESKNARMNAIVESYAAPETAAEAFTAQQALVTESKPPVSQLASDFVDSIQPEEEPVNIQSVKVDPENQSIDPDQYEALGILLKANGIDRDAMRAYCNLHGYLLPAKKPTLARMKVSEFSKFRDAVGGPAGRDIVAKINATKAPKGRAKEK